jgi:hypothetical protein
MSDKRDNKGRFVKKKSECKIRKFKESVKSWANRQQDAVITGILLLIVWILFTGAFWVFWEKSTTVETCENVTGWCSWDYYDRLSLQECFADHVECRNTVTKSYYTLPEIIGIEFDGVREVFDGGVSLIEWAGKHPII